MKKVIATKNAPAAIGPYSQAVQVGNMLFASGQLGLDPATGNFAEGGVKEQTVQAFKNVHAILEEAGLSINDVVKTTVFLADMSDFAAMNEVYASQFEGTFPARSAVADTKIIHRNSRIFGSHHDRHRSVIFNSRIILKSFFTGCIDFYSGRL